MTRDRIPARWEAQFSTWAQSPSNTETDKIENVLTAVKKAINNDAKLAPVTKVFVQGSYRNRVNVRLDSDVDVGVLYTGTNLFGVQYPAGKTDADFGNEPAAYNYSQYKNDVGVALKRHFGSANVTRGAKAFDIHENTYRVDADVVPLIVHKYYIDSGFYICGTQLTPDDGYRIINWPERLFDSPNWAKQHYENGLEKNNNTSRAYRAAVRILKKLRNRMEGNGVTAANPIKGFFVECMVWNVPNDRFAHATWIEVINDVLLYLDAFTSTATLCNDWREVNGLKSLFTDDEKRKQAAAFIAAARRYLE